jgi:hypothetical protein
LIRALGQPFSRLEHLIDGCAVISMWFSPSSLMRGRDLSGGNRDRDRAARLFGRGRHRGAALGSGLAVVIWPNWPEPAAPFVALSQERMRKLGFVLADRRA